MEGTRVRLDLELVMIVHGQLDVKHQPTYDDNLLNDILYLSKQCKDGVIEYNYEPARAPARPPAHARPRAPPHA